MDGADSRPITALLDTGAHSNLLAMEVAQLLLGMSSEKIKKDRAVEKKFNPAGPDEFVSYGWKLTFKLRGTARAKDFLLFRDSMVYITESKLPQTMLFGQTDGFQEKIFKHYSRSINRFWEIRV
ncbi:hypothetical protein [Roseimicrobium sp. ORNL1]|uniref:hypothetical protein n=1 Tax=Roseimicrobium sp. ORNL1 TaxID=2711231 RepID=UPI0013E13B2E|nr:hypothetical protein [Roseimicrobium sp. ORNL1]QIF02215.1 hypothetical protein G5S37_11970 [Roseimicrobium sp. ORNL1]